MAESILNKTIRDKMYNHGVSIDHEMLWSNIQKEKRRTFPYYYILGGLLLLSAIGLFAYYTSSNKTVDTSTQSITSAVTPNSPNNNLWRFPHKAGLSEGNILL